MSGKVTLDLPENKKIKSSTWGIFPISLYNVEYIIIYLYSPNQKLKGNQCLHPIRNDKDFWLPYLKGLILQQFSSAH